MHLVDIILWLEKTIRCHISSFRIDSTAFVVLLEMLVSKQNWQSISRKANMAAVVKCSLSMSNAACCAFFHLKACSFFSKSFKEQANLAKFLMNLQWKLVSLKKLQTPLMFFGFGYSKIALTFGSSVLIPLTPIILAKNFTFFLEKKYFSGLMKRSFFSHSTLCTTLSYSSWSSILVNIIRSLMWTTITIYPPYPWKSYLLWLGMCQGSCMPKVHN